MTLAYFCILLAALLPIGATGVAKWGTFGKSRRDGGYDNHDPRAWLARQTGHRARANAAQANSFEALPFFIGAVLAAHQMGAAQGVIDALAGLWVLLRVAYIALYVADRAAARSLVWFAAFVVNAAILFAAAAWR
jgi:uncharacterized MAPEG superfamily protein